MHFDFIPELPAWLWGWQQGTSLSCTAQETLVGPLSLHQSALLCPLFVACSVPYVDFAVPGAGDEGNAPWDTSLAL